MTNQCRISLFDNASWGDSESELDLPIDCTDTKECIGAIRALSWDFLYDVDKAILNEEDAEWCACSVGFYEDSEFKNLIKGVNLNKYRLVADNLYESMGSSAYSVKARCKHGAEIDKKMIKDQEKFLKSDEEYKKDNKKDEETE